MPNPVTNPAVGPEVTVAFRLMRIERQRWEVFYARSDNPDSWTRKAFTVYGRGGVSRAEHKLRALFAETLQVRSNNVHLRFDTRVENRAYYGGVGTAHCHHTFGTMPSGECRGGCGTLLLTEPCPDCSATVYPDATDRHRAIGPQGSYGVHNCPEGRDRRAREAEEQRQRQREAALAEQRRRNEERRNSPDFLCQLGTGEIR